MFKVSSNLMHSLSPLANCDGQNGTIHESFFQMINVAGSLFVHNAGRSAAAGDWKRGPGVKFGMVLF